MSSILIAPFLESMELGLAIQADLSSGLSVPDTHKVYWPEQNDSVTKEMFKRLTEWQLNSSSLSLGDQKIHIELTSNPGEHLNHVKTKVRLSETLHVVRSSLSKPLCIGVSGGIDSTIAILYAVYALRYKPHDIVLLNLNYGAPYNKKESVALQIILKKISTILGSATLGKYPVNVPFTYHTLNSKQLITSEMMPKGYIIPNRNSVMAAFSACIAETFWISANYRKVDDEPGAAMDKSRKYFGLMTSILSGLFSETKIVTSPFMHMSKSESIKWLISVIGADEAYQLLSSTVTCYDANSNCCGECFACYKAAKSLYEIEKEFPKLHMFSDRFAGRGVSKNISMYISNEISKGRSGPSEDFLNAMTQSSFWSGT